MIQEEKTKPINIYFSKNILEKIKEMSNYYGISRAEMIRLCVSGHFSNGYRKDRYGYLSGTENGKKGKDRQIKSEYDAQLQEFHNMTPIEINEYLENIGFMNNPDASYYHEVRFNPNGVKMWSQVYTNGSSVADMWTIDELINHVKKFLKNKI